MRDKVRDLIKTDRRLTVRCIADELGIGTTTVDRILTEDFKMRKVSARWVPKLLSDEERVKPETNAHSSVRKKSSKSSTEENLGYACGKHVYLLHGYTGNGALPPGTRWSDDKYYILSKGNEHFFI
ncbi:hypothetical protein DPMN_042752 [Dreissena polymorpha]|uniref:Transposase n=1 Tax=Dreissena polymorpha TaxID=45954 RepID=A0A9D4D1L2_DREPO|nr:hypothetical protein DPMN_042752 [Dreissena polymorpha]